jgi:hypothetical protein
MACTRVLVSESLLARSSSTTPGQVLLVRSTYKDG